MRIAPGHTPVVPEVGGHRFRPSRAGHHGPGRERVRDHAGRRGLPESESFGPNDRVRIATIGMGIIGFIDTDTALKVPGVELVAVADLYEGRRVHAKEVFGDRIDDPRRLPRDPRPARRGRGPHLRARPLARPDLDRRDEGRQGRLLREADGPASSRRARRSSPRRRRPGPSSRSAASTPARSLYDKVRELIKSGAIGAINSIEARYNRNSPIGAWQYSLPTDASPETVDWDRFLGDAPKRPFDADPLLPLAELLGLRHGRRGRPVRPPAHGHPPRRPARSARPGSRAWAASGTGRTGATSTT